MKVGTMLLATALAASLTGVAFAQTNRDSATKPEQMDKQDTMKASKGSAMKPGAATTGAAVQSKDTAASPASQSAPSSDVKKDK